MLPVHFTCWLVQLQIFFVQGTWQVCLFSDVNNINSFHYSINSILSWQCSTLEALQQACSGNPGVRVGQQLTTGPSKTLEIGPMLDSSIETPIVDTNYIDNEGNDDEEEGGGGGGGGGGDDGTGGGDDGTGGDNVDVDDFEPWWRWWWW